MGQKKLGVEKDVDEILGSMMMTMQSTRSNIEVEVRFETSATLLWLGLCL